MFDFLKKEISKEMGEEELKAMGAGNPEDEESEVILYGKGERQ